MSLYNALFGNNPLSTLLLRVTGAKPDRFRDAWLEKQDGKPVIAIYTKTGGGNRECNWEGEEEHACYHIANEQMAKLPTYIRDEDDGYDSTYATFYFRSPPELESVLLQLLEKQGELPPVRERWEKVLADLRSEDGPKTEEGKRALEVGKQVLDPIMKFLSEAEKKVT